MTAKFKIGDKVCKPKGYGFDGIIVPVFQNTKGEVRYVAEFEGNGMLHIFSEGQLEFRGNPSPETPTSSKDVAGEEG